MKPEKMTPEELDLTRRDAALPLNMQTPPPDERRRLLAHIAALEAERDEGARILDEVQAITTPHSSPDELVASTVERLARERDAFASRVEDLERREGVIDAERDAAARRMEVAESTLAGMRQRAGDAKALAEVLRRTEATWTDEAMAEVARYIVGEDGAGTRPELKHEGPCHHGVPCPPAPTTAEAFATVRTLVTGVPRGAEVSSVEGERLLSLLERRMGEMGRALRLGSKALDELQKGGRLDWDGYETLRDAFSAALTDAPTVFTLEEVEAVVRGALTDSGEWAPVVGIVMGAIRERLHALRR